MATSSDGEGGSFADPSQLPSSQALASNSSTLFPNRRELESGGRRFIFRNRRRYYNNGGNSMPGFAGIVTKPSPQFFKILPRLPLEIRHMIWAWTACQDRIVEIKYNERNKKKNFPSKTPVPAMLHACSESRAVGLKFYQELDSGGGYFSGAFINWDRDVIFFNTYDRVAEHLYLGLDLPGDPPGKKGACLKVGIADEALPALERDPFRLISLHTEELVILRTVDDSPGNLLPIKPKEIMRRQTKEQLEKVRLNHALSQITDKYKNIKRVGVMDTVRDGRKLLGKEGKDLKCRMRNEERRKLPKGRYGLRSRRSTAET